MDPFFLEQEYIYMIENALESAASASSISSLISLAAYVFSSLAIYTIAQRRGIRHAWMAWIPMLNVWILGSISDQYRYVVKGQIKSKRKVLLALNILNVLIIFAAFIYMIVTIVRMFMGEMPFAYEEEVIWKLLSCLLYFIPAVILSVAGFIVEVMALYDLYASCEPDNKVLYLVLSLIPGINTITHPLFLFLCRDKDGGMPPRRENAAENPAEF